MISFLTKEFTDFRGDKHLVTACIFRETSIWQLGWACQHVGDKCDMKLAKQIAVNRASNHRVNNVIECVAPGFIHANEGKFMEFILKCYIDYLCDNPAIMIKGYKHEKTRYLKKQQQIIDNV